MSVPIDPPGGGEPRDATQIQRAAVQGVSVLIARSVGVQLLTAAATIALARLLSPSDYGAFAVAMAVQLLGRSAVELGLPIALVRRERAPTLSEQRAVTGFMLASGTAISLAIIVVAFVLLPSIGVEDEVARVVAVACCALPLYGLRVAPVVLIERRLQFGRLAVIEVCETLSFYFLAVPAAFAGFGPYAMALGVPFSAVAGAVSAYVVQPWKFGAHLQLSAIRPMARFGAQATLLSPAYFARELGILGVLAAMGGQAAAGFYSLAQRLFSLPLAILSAVSRVSTAALAREEGGLTRTHLAARAVGVTTVGAGLPLAVAVGASNPLIAALFGERWLPAADVVAAAAPGMLLTSAATVLVGLALADGDARSPLVAMGSGAVAAVATAFPLAASLDELGGGIASTIGFTLGTAVLLLRVDPVARASIVPALRALAVGVGAAVAGRLVASGTGVPDLVIALSVSVATWLSLSVLITREDLLTLVRLVRRHALSGLRHRQPPDEDVLLQAVSDADTAGV